MRRQKTNYMTNRSASSSPFIRLLVIYITLKLLRMAIPVVVPQMNNRSDVDRQVQA